MNLFIRYFLILFIATAIFTNIPSSNAQIIKNSFSSITGANALCVNASITLIDTNSNGKWSSKDTTIAKIDSITGIVFGVAVGIDTIFYTTSIDTATFVITVNLLPNAGIILGFDSVCQGSSITLSDLDTGGIWDISNAIAVVSIGIVTGISAGIDTITYSVTNSCGTAIATKPVTILPLPIPGLISGGDVCKGATNTFISSASGGSWSCTNSNASVNALGVVTGVKLGFDTIVYTVSNICGIQSAKKQFKIDTIAYIAPIVGSSRVCRGSICTLTDSIKGGTWNIINALATIASSDSFGVVTGVNAGKDTVIYIITNSCGSVNVKLGIKIDTFPIAGAIICKDSLCEGATITVQDTIGAPLGVSVWQATNGNATVQSGLIHGLWYGLDTIIYTVINSCGSATTQKVIFINKVAYPGIINGPDTVCLGSSVTYLDTIAVNAGVWNTGIMSFDSLSTIFTPTQIGLTSIIYTVKNKCGTKTTTKIIEILAAPNSLITTATSGICLNTSIAFTNVIKGGVWTSINGNAFVGSQNGIVIGENVGLDTIVYIISNMCGVDSNIMPISVNPIPVAPVIKQKGNLLSVDKVYTTYQWTLDGLSILNATSDTYTLVAPGVYEIWVSNIYGCSILSTYKNIGNIAPCDISSLMIYPNPTENVLNINWCAYVNAKLTTLDGKPIFTQYHVHQLNLSALPSGSYILIITDDFGNTLFNKMIDKVAK